MNKILQGDCLELFPSIEDSSIDLIVTSPPYNIGIDYDNYNDYLKWSKYLEWIEKWLYECYRVLKDDGSHTKEEMKAEINTVLKKDIGAIALCDDIAIVPDVPKTRSGKIMRRILRSIVKGEEITQDTSTLEDPSIVGIIEGIVKEG